ncbi:MAG: NUDIX hydrolase, partial [Pseudarcicella sp.]|nr:NUDIX hydrolase [Pseudarcicella sp.]
KGIYGWTHFKNKAIAILPIDQENNIWLVGQYRYPLNEYSWEVPMGGGALDVDSLISAQRELKEETGIIAKNWTYLGKIHTSNSVTNETGFMYLAENIEIGTPEPDETEILTIQKVSLTNAVKMVMNDEITDSLSIAIILKVARLKNI